MPAQSVGENLTYTAVCGSACVSTDPNTMKQALFAVLCVLPPDDQLHSLRSESLSSKLQNQTCSVFELSYYHAS